MRRDDQGRVADYRDGELIRIAHQRLAEAAHAGYILARAQSPAGNPAHPARRVPGQCPLAAGSSTWDWPATDGRCQPGKVALDDALKLDLRHQPVSRSSDYWGDWLGDYGSRLRDSAMAYALLHRHQVTHPSAKP